MQLNLPIVDQLADSENILVAGVGGGQDVLIGLPIYFTLRAMGKNVHLASYSFSEVRLVGFFGDVEVLAEDQVVGARGSVHKKAPYYPEGFLSQWFKEERAEDVTVWLLAKTGVAPLMQNYGRLVEHLEIDALILVDGGVDSLMRGDETGPGTLIEDSISLAAVESLDIPVKILGCLGFGTEVEEMLCHHHALENMAALAREGAFYGTCALTAQMEVFQLFESAARYIWEHCNNPPSHISTRVIPAVRGEFGNHHMYDNDRLMDVFVSPLMSLYWFFNAEAVIRRSLIIEHLRATKEVSDAIQVYRWLVPDLKFRRRRPIPY